MSLANAITKAYLKRFQKTLHLIRSESTRLQEKEQELIKNSPLFKTLKKNQSWEEMPVSTYSDIQNEIQEKINFNQGPFEAIKTYAKSAGTTSNIPKLIPCSQEFLHRNHVRAAWLTMSLIYSLRGDMDIIKRKNLLIGGAIYESTKDLVIADISGLLIRNIPKYYHSYYVPTIAEATRSDWDKKLNITAKKASTTDQVIMFAGVPTWILTVAKRVLELTESSNLSDVWPHFKVYLHGGVDFDPYRSQFEALFPNNNVLYLDVYNASEGFFAVQDLTVNEGMLLLTNHGIYYEFIELSKFRSENYQIINLSEARVDEEYVILISNLSGLFRYVLGDTIRFASIHPFRIKITGRITEFINAFGEDLTYEHVKKALSNAESRFDFKVRDYTIAPRYLSKEEKGCHEWYVEFEKTPKDPEGLVKMIDDEIRSVNFSYHQKRTDDLAISAPEIISLPKGFFDDFARHHGKFGGQNKLPKLRNNRDLVNEINTFRKRYHPKSNHG